MLQAMYLCLDRDTFPGPGKGLQLADIGVGARSKSGIMPNHANKSRLTFLSHSLAQLPVSASL